ncbi:unnamed protein product [Albugo candida]|uniref:Uncharacterized protein n=1 Tax=Albugo candida TaxID=65357 RepID=A0A024GTD2_9STRA|nr:unnamed protein product [Albugo candida]|eukprot:CCI50218.1 unnamed protein product [Albugo candida]
MQTGFSLYHFILSTTSARRRKFTRYEDSERKAAYYNYISFLGAIDHVGFGAFDKETFYQLHLQCFHFHPWCAERTLKEMSLRATRHSAFLSCSLIVETLSK